MTFNYVEFEYIFKVFPKQKQNNKEIKNIKIEKKKKKRQRRYLMQTIKSTCTNTVAL